MRRCRTAAWLFALMLCAACAKGASAEDRVKAAREAQTKEIAELFQKAGVAYPPGEIYLRAFKQEGVVELWAGARGAPLTFIRNYDVCASSGELGPKRKQGDGQVPEGFYEIDRFNPWSNFHLSLGVNYPNDSDRLRGEKGNLGGDIFIHGSCVTIGCLPLRDGPIEQLYLIALDARTAGQKRIPVHIFPAKLGPVAMARLKREAEPSDALWAFWQELQPGYLAFEQTRRPPRVTVDGSGRYRVREVGQPVSASASTPGASK